MVWRLGRPHVGGQRTNIRVDPRAQDVLKAALRDVVGPHLRSHGFKGSGSRWRLMNEFGDAAVVGVQRSSSSTATELRCLINLAVVPEPWLAWNRAQGIQLKSADESVGLWRDRLHAGPLDREVWWRVRDVRDAASCARDMVQQLEETGVPTLQRLLNRDALLETLRLGELGFGTRAAKRRLADLGLAVLLSDAGRSAELEQLLRNLELNPSDGTAYAQRKLVDWASARAQLRSNG